MPKKKNIRKAPEDNDEQMISEVFKSGIGTVRKSCKNKNAAKIYDLEGVILKRRKAATQAYLAYVRERYGASIPKSALSHMWAVQNSAMGHSIDGLDYLYYFTAATAIWMLDALKRSGRLRNAYPYFVKDVQRLDAIRMPDMFDPCHDDLVIRGMMELIQERDERDNPFQWYISSSTAKRKTPVNHTEPPSDPDNMTPRERFNAVMDMIHPTLKERAVRRFEEKLWEFLDIVFLCAKEPAELCESLKEELEKLFHECRILHSRLCTAEGTKKKPASASVLLKPRSTMTVPTNMLPPGFDAKKQILDRLAYRDDPLEDSYNRLKKMAEQGLHIQDELDNAEETLVGLLCMAHMAPLMSHEELEENLGGEITNRLLAFEVEDPYEICFGYLCLIEAGSDLPWLYNASLAVLIAAVRKLPWNALSEEPEMLAEMAEDYGDEEDEKDGDLYEIESDAPSQPQIVVGPKDWNYKKADLYRLAYSDKPLLYPDELSEPERRINLPQMIYGVTGIIMPRNVSDFDEMAEAFAEAGMEPGLAKGMELYLQLALDVQSPSKDWEAFLQSDHFQYLNDLYGKSKEAASDTKAVDIEMLQHSVKDARAEIDSLRTELHQARKETEARRKEAERILRETAGERQELISLRELIYRQANENGIEDVPDQGGIELPYTSQRRIVVFGGHDTWLKAIRPMLPNVTFVPKEKNPNANMIRAAETVWIQPNALSHANYYKIINIVRQNQIPVYYFGYASAQKCALQLAKFDGMEQMWI